MKLSPYLCAAMDGNLPSLARVFAFFFVPIAFLILVPLLLLFVVGFYLLAVLQGVRSLVALLLGRPVPVEETLQRPHFLEAQASRQSQSESESSQAT